MAVPFTDEDDREQIYQVITEETEEKNPDCKKAITLSIASTETSNMGFNSADVQPRSVVLSRLVIISFILLSVQKITLVLIQARKSKKTYKRPKIKLKCKENFLSKEYIRNEYTIKSTKQKWILQNIVKPFQKILPNECHTYPFLPQDNKLCRPDDKSYQISETMKYEGSRFASFASFPDIQGLYVTKLASAGFYYSGIGDEVTCYTCGLKYRNWSRKDSPMEIHKQLSPNCPFVGDSTSQDNGFHVQTCTSHDINEACKTSQDITGSTKKNLTNGVVDVERDNQESVGQNISEQNLDVRSTGSYAHRQLAADKKSSISHKSSTNDTNSLVRISKIEINPPNVTTTNTYYSSSNQSSAIADRKDLVGVMVVKPKYPNYTAREARIESFNQWPRHLTQSVDEMTNAGFFFTGIEDHCRCFYCGGGLKNWEKDDRPATEHARWYPNCAFILHLNNSASLLTASVQTNEVSKQQNHIGNTHIESTSNDFMNHSAVKIVLELGFAKSVIKNAYESLQQSSRANISTTDLLTVILDLEDKANGHHSTTSVERKPERTPENKINKTADQHLQESIRCLEEENQNLRDQQTCKICLDEPVAIVFLPCGHMASCINCAPALRLCPICRAFIKGTIKAVMT